MVYDKYINSVYRCNSDATYNATGNYCAIDYTMDAVIKNSKVYAKWTVRTSNGLISTTPTVFDITNATNYFVEGNLSQPNRKIVVVPLMSGHESDQYEVWIENVPNDTADSDYGVSSEVALLPGKSDKVLIEIDKSRNSIGIGTNVNAGMYDTLMIGLKPKFIDDVNPLYLGTYSLNRNSWKLDSQYSHCLTLELWPENEQKKIGSDDIIFVSGSHGWFETYRDCGIYCSSYTDNSLIFECSVIPQYSVTVEVLIIKR